MKYRAATNLNQNVHLVCYTIFMRGSVFQSRRLQAEEVFAFTVSECTSRRQLRRMSDIAGACCFHDNTPTVHCYSRRRRRRREKRAAESALSCLASTSSPATMATEADGDASEARRYDEPEARQSTIIGHRNHDDLQACRRRRSSSGSSLTDQLLQQQFTQMRRRRPLHQGCCSCADV